MTQPLSPSTSSFDSGGQNRDFVLFLRRAMMDMETEVVLERETKPAYQAPTTTKTTQIGALTLSAEFDEVIAAMGIVQAAVNENGLLIAQGKNDVFQNDYAPLQYILKAISPLLRQNGITLLQPYEANGNHVRVTTIFMKGKQFASMTSAMMAESALPQSIGSAITYCCRYSIRAMLGLAVDSPGDRDDDGNAASGKSVSDVPVNATEVNAVRQKEKPSDSDVAYTPALRRYLKSAEAADLDALQNAKRQMATFKLSDDEKQILERFVTERIESLFES
jgi:hypothetical protein